MGSKKMNPPRRRTKEQVRADNRKQLAAREVSGTVEIEALAETNGTDKLPPSEKTITPQPIRDSQKLTKTHLIIGIIGGIITILIFVSWIVYNYTSLKEGLNHTNTNLKELKQTTNERMNRLEERMDKYISKEKSK